MAQHLHQMQVLRRHDIAMAVSCLWLSADPVCWCDAPVGGSTFFTNMKIAFSGLTLILFRMT